jgi:hypothetical protein
VFRRVAVVAALLALALATPWPLLLHLLHTPPGQRAAHAAIFVLILFAVFCLPVILVRRQRRQSAAPRRRAATRRKSPRAQPTGESDPPVSSRRP